VSIDRLQLADRWTGAVVHAGGGASKTNDTGLVLEHHNATRSRVGIGENLAPDELSLVNRQGIEVVIGDLAPVGDLPGSDVNLSDEPGIAGSRSSSGLTIIGAPLGGDRFLAPTGSGDIAR